MEEKEQECLKLNEKVTELRNQLIKALEEQADKAARFLNPKRR